MMIAPASRAAAFATASSLSYVSGGATADQIIILFMVDGETMADGGKTSPRRLLAVVIIAFVVTRIPLMLQGWDISDEALWMVVTGRWLDGGHLYIDAFERRPPLLFLIYAAVLEPF